MSKKIRKLAGKAHPNIYEAVELFKAEQTATEVSLMQLAAGGLPVRRRRKYRRYEKRLPYSMYYPVSAHPLLQDCSLYWKRRQQSSDKFFTCKWL